MHRNNLVLSAQSIRKTDEMKMNESFPKVEVKLYCYEKTEQFGKKSSYKHINCIWCFGNSMQFLIQLWIYKKLYDVTMKKQII